MREEKKKWKTLAEQLALLGRWVTKRGLPDPMVILREVSSPSGLAEGALRRLRQTIIGLDLDIPQQERASDEAQRMEKVRTTYEKFVLLEFPYLQNCIYMHEFPDLSKLEAFQELLKIALLEEGS